MDDGSVEQWYGPRLLITYRLSICKSFVPA